MTAALLDLFSPEYVKDPYPLYRQLRAIGPFASTNGGWVLSRHADVMAALMSESVGHFSNPPSAPEPYNVLQRMFLRLNRPDHSAVRRAIAPLFTPPSARAQEARSRRRAALVMRTAAREGSLDVVNDLACLVGGRLVADLLGVEEDGVPEMLALSRVLFRTADYAPDMGALEGIERAGRLLIAFMVNVVKAHERRPRRDVVSLLLAAERKGQIEHNEVLGACVLMVLAGVETTSALIGTAVLALFKHPDQMELLRRRTDLAAAAIDEFARYHSPTQRSTRMALADFDVGGIRIRANQTLLLLFGSANRDPLAFDDPERLDITRQAPHHLGWGRGIHCCLGNHFARRSGGAMLSELLRYELRPGVPLAEVRWRPSHTIHGLESLPVLVQPA